MCDRGANPDPSLWSLDVAPTRAEETPPERPLTRRVPVRDPLAPHISASPTCTRTRSREGGGLTPRRFGRPIPRLRAAWLLGARQSRDSSLRRQPLWRSLLVARPSPSKAPRVPPGRSLRVRVPSPRGRFGAHAHNLLSRPHTRIRERGGHPQPRRSRRPIDLGEGRMVVGCATIVRQRGQPDPGS